MYVSSGSRKTQGLDSRIKMSHTHKENFEGGATRMTRAFISPYTPRRDLQRRATPTSRRLIPSIRRVQEDADYEALMMKQWKIYSLSPLYNFKKHRSALVKYSRSLDVALSQAQSSSGNPFGSGSEKSNFSFYEPLQFHPGDPPALRVQVMERSGTGTKVSLEALLVCVEPSFSPVPDKVKSHFTFYPVVLVSGNKARTTVLFDWLERHFDCRSDAMEFSCRDLRCALTLFSGFMSGHKSLPVLLQYSLRQVCDGIDFINCSLDTQYCKRLWEKFFMSPESQVELQTKDVDLFVGHIESFLEHMMSIVFKKLTLSEVGTPSVYISHLGKMKIFSPSVVYTVLNFLCNVACTKLQSFSHG